MRIIRQKYYSCTLEQREFIKLSTKIKAGIARFSKDAGMVGRYVGRTVKNAVKETGEVLSHPVESGKTLVNGAISDNKQALKYLNDTVIITPIKGAASIAEHVIKGEGKQALQAAKETGTKLGNLALDLNPLTAGGKAILESGEKATKMTGTDVVKKLVKGEHNPYLMTGKVLEKARITQLGAFGDLSPRLKVVSKVGKATGGTWVGKGANDACLGTAPDRWLTQLGNKYGESHAGEIAEAVEAKVNSREGRKLANRIQKKIDTVNNVKEKITGFGSKVKGFFTGKSKQQPQPQSVLA